ncbi:MAG TPA: YciI family protein [Chitinophaga sp.]
MKDYLLLFRGGPQYVPTSQPGGPISANWMAWMEDLMKKGHLPQGQRLVGGTGAVLKGRKAAQLTDGPFAEGKEIVAGYLAIKAEDLDQAISLAKGCPIFEHDDVSTEIREIAS